MDNFQRIVGENIGYASMCWIPHPSGVFDSTQAQVAVDAIMAAHKAEIERLTAELKRVQELHTGLMKNADDRYDALTAELTDTKNKIALLADLSDFQQRTNEFIASELAAAKAKHYEECAVICCNSNDIADAVNNIRAALTDKPAGPQHSERKP